MDYKDREIKIRQLLDAYFEGETTLQEEETLRDYFSSEEVPEDLVYAKPIFGAASAISEQKSSVELDLSFLSEDKPASASIQSVPRRARRLTILYRAASVAAVVAVAFVLTFTLKPEKQTVYCYLNGEPVTSIELASRQADMATRLIETSARISQDGAETVREASKPLEKLDMMMKILSGAE